MAAGYGFRGRPVTTRRPKLRWLFGLAALAGLGLTTIGGARATVAPAVESVPRATGAGYGQAPSLASAIAALSIAERSPSDYSSLAAAAVASDLARYLTPMAAANPKLAPSGPTANGLSAQGFGGLLDAADSVGVVIPFGVAGRNGRLSRGVTVAVAAGATVFAPFDAQIGFAAELEGYGGVIILLDPSANDQALVLTGLSTVAVQEGAQIARGSTLGRVAGDSEKAATRQDLTDEAIPSPELYIEVRSEGRVLDPANWLRARN